MNQAEMLTLLKLELRDTATQFTDNELGACIDTSERETGFSLPTSENFRIHWVKERAKRACFYMLLIDNAPKVRYEQIYLQQKYDHYNKIIAQMDKDFAKAVKDNGLEFSGIDVDDLYKMFGSNISSGFAYSDITGEDITYEDYMKVVTSP